MTSTGWLRFLLLSVPLALLPPAATAQNQVDNPDFDTDFSGWAMLSNGSSATFWAAEDSAGRSDSGSVLVAGVSTPAGPSTFAYFYGGAATVTPGTMYVVGGAVRVDRSADGRSEVRFGVNWFSGPEYCFKGGEIRLDWGPFIPEGSPWTSRLMRLTAPPGAHYGCMFLLASNGHASFAVHLDQAYFGTPITGLDLILKDDLQPGK